MGEKNISLSKKLRFSTRFPISVLIASRCPLVYVLKHKVFIISCKSYSHLGIIEFATPEAMREDSSAVRLIAIWHCLYSCHFSDLEIEDKCSRVMRS